MDLPFSIVEAKTLRDRDQAYAEAGRHAPKDIGKYATQKEITSLSVEAKAALIKKLRGETVCRTTDHWTSRDGRAFEGNPIRWIDGVKFSMEHAYLDCKEYKGTTDAASMHKKYITKMTTAWGIDLGRDAFVSSTTN
jgi:hypothetical protein